MAISTLSPIAAISKSPTNHKKEWVVGLSDGTRMFVKAEKYTQDESSLIFYNGANLTDNNTVLQIEKIHMMWLSPDSTGTDVLISYPNRSEDLSSCSDEAEDEDVIED